MALPADASQAQQPLQPQPLAQHLAAAAQNHDASRLAAATEIWLDFVGSDSGISSAPTSAASSPNSFHSAFSYPNSPIGPDFQDSAEILCFMASGITERDCMLFEPDQLSPVSAESLSMDSATTQVNFEDPLYVLSTVCSSFQPNSQRIYENPIDLPYLPFDMNFSNTTAPSPQNGQCFPLLPEDWSFLTTQTEPSFYHTDSPSTHTIGSPGDIDMSLGKFDFSDINIDAVLTPPLFPLHTTTYQLPLFEEQDLGKLSNRVTENDSWNEMMALLAAVEQTEGTFGGCDGFYGGDAAEQMLVNSEGWVEDAEVWMGEVMKT